MAELIARVDGREVGRFSEQHISDGSLFAFEYVEEATVEDLVSLTMIPLPRQRRFDSRSFPPAFDMILPEGERRQRIEAARKIVRTDHFSLLSYVGANPVNRVRFLQPGAAVDQDVPRLPTPKEIVNCTAGQALFQKLMADLDLRQGIAGVQPKVLGAVHGAEKLSLDLRQQRGSTHILKASTPAFPYLAANEFICLKVFEASGLTIPNVTLSADGELLLVERFDVLGDASHLGFEEAAALMGESSATKYQRDYGTMIESLALFVSAQTEDAMRRDMTKALVLNWLLGNGDAHLKNFGVLYHDDLDARLAPFYDVVSTLPYIPEDVPALALSFDWYSKAWWPRAKVEEFARTHGRLSREDTARLFEECLAGVSAGLKLADQVRRQINGFAELAAALIKLWTTRLAMFRAG
ncbi:MAG: type II toxin-antitoxin system HipA family toxin [Steroidobacteraceae bacterium]